MEGLNLFSSDKPPQLKEMSSYLHRKTGFTLKPVEGLLSARDFLNPLAYRVFNSTQQLRHHGNPFQTPEPDLVHEIMGHVVLFANPKFADFTQLIGLASLSISDEDIDKLASLQWFTVEFGLLKEEGQLKAQGAGILSSFGELEWACSEEPSDECRASGSLSKELKRPE